MTNQQDVSVRLDDRIRHARDLLRDVKRCTGGDAREYALSCAEQLHLLECLPIGDRPHLVDHTAIEDFGNEKDKLAQANRLARYALMSAKEAPVGIVVMKSLVIGLARARSLENMAPRSLNVAVVYQNNAPAFQLPEQLLEDE